MPKIIGGSLAEHRRRTRAALFDALSTLMSERAFEKIALSDVAAQAGVGRTAVYNHFNDKEDLLLAFLENEAERYANHLNEALAGVTDPIDRLRVYVQQQALLRLHFHSPSSGPLARSVSHHTAHNLRSHGERINAIVAGILQEAMDAGMIPEQDPGQVIPLINATIMGGRPTPTEPTARATYLEALDAFVLRAIGAPAPDHPVPVSPTSDLSEPESAPAREGEASEGE